MYAIRKYVFFFFKFPEHFNHIGSLRKKAYTNDDNPGKYHINWYESLFIFEACTFVQ